MMHGDYYHSFWHWGAGSTIMGIAVILIAVAVGLVVYYAVRGGSAGIPLLPGRDDSALEILKRRYAKGEISKEEFQEMRKDLE